MDGFTWTLLVVGVVSVLVTGALVAWGVRFLEAQNRREAEATRLQERLSAPLGREPRLQDCSLLPAASIPARGPARVEVTGWVTSQEQRDMALRLVEHEAAQAGRPIEVVDRLSILPAGGADTSRRSA
jgi:hypothetical protein